MKDYEKIEKLRRDLTLVLMYLNRIEDNSLPKELKKQFGPLYYTWKGYDFADLDYLQDEELIDQGKNKNKKAYLTEKGMEKASKLLDKYFNEN